MNNQLVPRRSQLLAPVTVEPRPASRSGGRGRAILRRLWLIPLFVVLGLGAAYVWSSRTVPLWRATGQLILVQRAATVSSSAQAAYAAPMVESVASQVAMIQSRAMAQRATDRLNRAPGGPPGGYRVDQVQKSITASAPPGTDVITVSVEAPSRAQAQAMADAVCLSFVDWKQELAQQNVRAALAGLRARSIRAHAEMVDADRALAAFNEVHQLVDANAQRNDFLDRVSTIQTEVSSLTQELASEKAHWNGVGQQLKTLNLAAEHGTGVRDDALIASLQQQLNQAEIARAEAGRKYTYAYPGVLPGMDAQIQSLKTRLSQAIKGVVTNKTPSLQDQAMLTTEYPRAQDAVAMTEAKLKAAVQLQAQLKQQSQGLPATDAESSRLTRAADMARSLYVSLQAPLNEARTALSLASGDVDLTQPPYTPRAPFRPNLRQNLLYGGLAGLVLALLTILITARPDRRLWTLTALDHLAPGSVLGSLPRFSADESRMLAGPQPPLEAAEAYSLARASLSLTLRSAHPDEGWSGQIVLVTSSIPGEGKSVTSAQLARSLARAGKSVILVDADMRRPSQKTLFPSDQELGLADVLAGDVDVEDALVASDTTGLSILHSGTPGRNPSELVSLPEMAETLLTLRGEADIIIIDTPPCSVVAEALLLAPQADSVICVVGAGQVDEDLVRTTAASLAAAAGDRVAFFLNRAPRERREAYKSYYYSGQAPRA
ncbi:MAG TPA: polysaccharide biosynthesis tyrosine autokinase [Armatimonadota bacterium]|nr:polysaccharide biosynthesis tyrosine autokinase [Armatimonadota bacterium]